MAPTQPADPNVVKPANVLILQPTVKDPETGAFYIHKDYVRQDPKWDVVDHISPINTKEKFGDVESWAAYVTKYGGMPPFEPLLTWSEVGLRAVIDYHSDADNPGRCQWLALHDFARSVQWNHWALLANGQARGQRAVLEALEDRAADIVEPDAATLLAVLRTLRTTANATAETELRADGSTHAVWTKNNSVKAGELDLPPEFRITLPVLKGHSASTADGKLAPVLYSLAVRVRVSVDDSARLTIRLSMPNAERTLEAAVEDQVGAAQALLGEGHRLYRAAER